MTITGIIAEYNPFHRGHAYHLARARKLTGADYLIVVMSGNYVQRGVPAMFDKFTRARAALNAGADLVLELPICCSSGSAEYFSRGAVDLLAQTGIVTDLCFGSECGDLSPLEEAACLLLEEPEEYRGILQDGLRRGRSYPEARAAALGSCLAHLPDSVLASPNNLLGIEYLKALNTCGAAIRPHTIPREGGGYHDLSMAKEQFASAGAIRRELILEEGRFTDPVLRQLPNPELYSAYYGKPPITEDAFSLLLLQKLRSIQGEPLSAFFDVPEELSNRIWNRLDEFTSFGGFAELLKTRNLTRTAVNRALLHILLDIRGYQPAAHLKVLGLRRDATELLTLLSMHGTLPLLTGLSGSGLPEHAFYADRLYESVRSLLHRQPFQNEHRQKLLIV